eukprot:9629416-Alexandrium_andersonii.AAC.1
MGSGPGRRRDSWVSWVPWVSWFFIGFSWPAHGFLGSGPSRRRDSWAKHIHELLPAGAGPGGRAGAATVNRACRQQRRESMKRP